jgi:hypothetical protein
MAATPWMSTPCPDVPKLSIVPPTPSVASCSEPCRDLSTVSVSPFASEKSSNVSRPLVEWIGVLAGPARHVEASRAADELVVAGIDGHSSLPRAPGQRDARDREGLRTRAHKRRALLGVGAVVDDVVHVEVAVGRDGSRPGVIEEFYRDRVLTGSEVSGEGEGLAVA